MKKALPMVLLASAAAAAPPPAFLRGIYVCSNDVSQISKKNASAFTQSLGIPGADGVLLTIGWDAVEPAMGQYQWDLLDQWMGTATAAGKKIDLAVKAGDSTPSWLFAAPPDGAGAVPLDFTVSPHGGATGLCQPETIAAPWDPAFLQQWDALLAALRDHLQEKGTYRDVTLLRLTGINRTTDELRLPAETAQSTGLACVSDAITTWQQAGYRPARLLAAWDTVTNSFETYFPDKIFSVAIITGNPFPRIDENGDIIQGTVPDQDWPLLTLASAKSPQRLVVQLNFLMPGEPASPEVVASAQQLGTIPAFQTNEYFGTTGGGAACSEPVTNPTPCTDATYLELLESGIYPLGKDNSLRGQYIEVFPANANAFPDDVWKAHLELRAPRVVSVPATLPAPVTGEASGSH